MCKCKYTPHTSQPEQWNWKLCSLCEKRGKCELCMVWRTGETGWRISCRKWLWGAQIRFPVASLFSLTICCFPIIFKRFTLYILSLMCYDELALAIITPFGHFLTVLHVLHHRLLFAMLVFMCNVKSLLTSISFFPVSTTRANYITRCECVLLAFLISIRLNWAQREREKN